MDISRRLLLTAPAAFAAPPPSQPNILFLFPDQLRSDFIQPNPSIPVRTPHISQLAAQGIRFTQAITPSPLCAPARACLAAGMEYDHCRVPSNKENFPLDQPTFYQLLRSAGYHVMGCGKFDLAKPALNWGLDGKRLLPDWGFSDGINNEGKHDAIAAYQRAGKPTGPFMAYLEKHGLAHTHIEDYEKRRGKTETFPTPLSDLHYGDNWIARNGLALLDAAPRNQPWFLQVNFNGPHSPWDITQSMEKRWRGARFPQPNRSTQFDSPTHQRVRQNYAAMIENIDARVGDFIAKVKARGELQNTLIVFSSDHGEMLGDHDLWGKEQPYHASVGVPLLLSGLDVRPNQVNHAPTSTLDLIATFLDYAKTSRPERMDSRSLRPVLTGQRNSLRSHALAGLKTWRLAFQENYKFIRRDNAPPLLYDRHNDPHENDNLAAAKPEIANRLAKLLPTPA